MKRFTWLGAVLIFTSVASASTPEQDARFLSAVKEAYAKRDKDAVIALTCMDGVTEQQKALLATMLANPPFSLTITSVQYQPVEPDASKSYTQNGVTYELNLPVTKEIVIKYAPAGGGESMEVTLYAGEKNGKLLLANFAPHS